MSRQHWDAAPSWPLTLMASSAYYLYTADVMEERGNMAGARAEAAVSSWNTQPAPAAFALHAFLQQCWEVSAGHSGVCLKPQHKGVMSLR